MSGLDDDFEYFIEQQLKMDGKENKTINTPTSDIDSIKFPIVPKTDTIKQLNQLPHTPLSLNKYHEIFTLFKLYITKSNPGINKRLFVKPSYVSKHVFEKTIQQIEQLNDFINNMNKAYANKDVYFDHILYNNDVELAQSYYQFLVSHIIKHYNTFYIHHKAAIDYVNTPTNIRGAGRKTRKQRQRQRQRQRQTRKQKIHKRSTKKRKQLKRKSSKYNSTKKSKYNKSYK